jgi:DNA-binding NarL/FixJ family response regulator
VSSVRKIVAYVPDLMDRSKVAAAADVTFVARPAELADAATANRADLVVVDVTRPGVVDALPSISVPVLGFSKHTNRQAIDDALAAGADRVLARSAFFARLDDLLAGRTGDPIPDTDQ